MQLTALETLGFAVKRLQYRTLRAADARLTPLGISLVQWNALREIGLHPGLCMHGLAERTFNSDQAFGTLMTRLLRHKLVERQPGAGRANVHRLTPRGKTLVAEGHKRLRHVLAKTFAPLDADERARLQGLLSKILGDENPDALPTTRGPVTGNPMVRVRGPGSRKGARPLPSASRRSANLVGGGAN